MTFLRHLHVIHYKAHLNLCCIFSSHTSNAVIRGVGGGCHSKQSVLQAVVPPHFWSQCNLCFVLATRNGSEAEGEQQLAKNNAVPPSRYSSAVTSLACQLFRPKLHATIITYIGQCQGTDSPNMRKLLSSATLSCNLHWRCT